ncbi:MAG: Rpn family recombination-promoting nuclease/putative transposase [Caldilineaceae bacterium]|nr:Rpn family recombination-promoting nuclease/putative transposase [Caldilineaceae bacterium]
MLQWLNAVVMPIHNIHDSGYKKLFSNRTIFRQLIETFVDEPWVKALDFSQAETLDKSFIADHYKATESDLIYKVKVQEQEAYIYLIGRGISFCSGGA